MRDHIRGTRCTVQRHNGNFCDAPAAEDMPFPICTRHAVKLYRRMRQVIETADPRQTAESLMRVLDADNERVEKQNKHTVYYIRVGDLIKIGCTVNLSARLRSYPPASQILATERGGWKLEQQRHDQFAALRADRLEWYHPAPALLDHIAKLRHLGEVRHA
jgi:hypothetical protein